MTTPERDAFKALYPPSWEIADDWWSELGRNSDEVAATMLDHFNGAGHGYETFRKLLKHIAEEEWEEVYYTLRTAVANRAKYEAEALGRE